MASSSEILLLVSLSRPHLSQRIVAKKQSSLLHDSTVMSLLSQAQQFDIVRLSIKVRNLFMIPIFSPPNLEYSHTLIIAHYIKKVKNKRFSTAHLTIFVSKRSFAATVRESQLDNQIFGKTPTARPNLGHSIFIQECKTMLRCFVRSS